MKENTIHDKQTCKEAKNKVFENRDLFEEIAQGNNPKKLTTDEIKSRILNTDDLYDDGTVLTLTDINPDTRCVFRDAWNHIKAHCKKLCPTCLATELYFRLTPLEQWKKG